MICKVKSLWAIRDIEHGKVFYFSSLIEMIHFVNKLDLSVSTNLE